MKQLFLLLYFFLFSSISNADPHYIQALHPFWGDKESDDHFFSLFSEPVSVHIDKYESLREGDVFIYVYVFTELELDSFKLDIDCSKATPSTDVSFWDISKDHNKTKKNLSWSLHPDKQKQAVWFYSPNTPIERVYSVTNTNGEIIREGKIKAPSCIETPILNTDKLTKEQRAVFNGEVPYSDLSDTVITSEWSVNTDGLYVYDYSIKSGISNKGEIAKFEIDVSCKWLSDERHGYRPKSKSNSNKQHYQCGIGEYRHISGSSNLYSYKVGWAPGVKPGETLDEFQIISKDAPVSRKYELSPSFDDGYIIPTGIPYSDFIITGMTTGPSCHPDNDFNNPNLPENIEKERKKTLLEQKRGQEERAKAPPVLCIGMECYQ